MPDNNGPEKSIKPTEQWHEKTRRWLDESQQQEGKKRGNPKKQELCTTDVVGIWGGVPGEYELEYTEFELNTEWVSPESDSFSAVEIATARYSCPHEWEVFPVGSFAAHLFTPRDVERRTHSIRRTLRDQVTGKNDFDPLRSDECPNCHVREGEVRGYYRLLMDGDKVSSHEPQSRDFILIQSLPERVLLVDGNGFPDTPPLRPVIEGYANLLLTLARTRGFRSPSETGGQENDHAA